MKKLLLGFAGEMVSGKTIVGEYMKEHHGAKVFELGAYAEETLERLGLSVDAPSIKKTEQFFRMEFGGDIFARACAKSVATCEGELAVIIDIRRREDLTYLRTVPGFRFCFITAPINLRYERLLARSGASEHKKSFDDFQDDHDTEREQEVKRLEHDADEVVDNAGTLEELHATLDAIVAKYR